MIFPSPLIVRYLIFLGTKGLLPKNCLVTVEILEPGSKSPQALTLSDSSSMTMREGKISFLTEFQ